MKCLTTVVDTAKTDKKLYYDCFVINRSKDAVVGSICICKLK